MNGVVLWHDIKNRKAVLWCEAHGDLAFLREDCDDAGNSPFFDVGDIVDFEVYIECNVRRARHARLVEKQTGKPVASKDRGADQGDFRPELVEQPSARVLPFCPKSGRASAGAG